jgi:peroxiredoxin Q/BCP
MGTSVTFLGFPLSMQVMLKVGDKAPDFTAITDSGATISLYQFLKTGKVVLYFYPKDNSPGCTAEAMAFRESWDKIRELGADIIGVSSDSVESHMKFKSSCQLPFTLITDEGSKIRKLYGATGLLIPPRVTFVIDNDGIIKDVYSSQLMARSHVKRAIQVLESLKKEV